MVTNPDQVIQLLRGLYGPDPLPKPFPILEAAFPAAAGEGRPGLSAHAKKRAQAVVASQRPLLALLGLPNDFAIEADARIKVRRQLGSLLQGLLAERLFEEIYKQTLGTTELRLEDFRGARNDTDYRVVNGSGRTVFRINIKFHGTLFQKAREMVGLEPEDCFALATYKIKQGVEKTKSEVFPYLFVVVSCPVTAADVGATIPAELVDLFCMIKASEVVPGKRSIEERIVGQLASGSLSVFQATLQDLHDKLASAKWRVLSARRADMLLRELLFDRVYAVKVPRFAQNYRNAEVDMHFSLAQDMTPLEDFLRKYKESGQTWLSLVIDRGEI